MYLLGIDNGGTVAKAAIFAWDGREVTVAACRTESMSPLPGWVEFDAEAMWQATAAAVRRAIDKAGISADRIAAVACTGHGNGLYLVDTAGHPVRNAIFSADTRARAFFGSVKPHTKTCLIGRYDSRLKALEARHRVGEALQARSQA